MNENNVENKIQNNHMKNLNANSQFQEFKTLNKNTENVFIQGAINTNMSLSNGVCSLLRNNNNTLALNMNILAEQKKRNTEVAFLHANQICGMDSKKTNVQHCENNVAHSEGTNYMNVKSIIANENTTKFENMDVNEVFRIAQKQYSEGKATV
jgi:hypothetical protein